MPAMTFDMARNDVSVSLRSTIEAPGATPLMSKEQPAGTGEYGSAWAYW